VKTCETLCSRDEGAPAKDVFCRRCDGICSNSTIARRSGQAGDEAKAETRDEAKIERLGGNYGGRAP
jgi:hypothetical protein